MHCNYQNNLQTLSWRGLTLLTIILSQCLCILYASAAEQKNKSEGKMHVREFKLIGIHDEQSGINRRQDIETIVSGIHQENSKGFTIDSLRLITDSITDYYRKQGYFLASAYIPEQSVINGVVTIQVLEGVLAEIITEGNKLYSKKRLQHAFIKHLSQPVQQKKIESTALHLNDYPGYESSVIFSPGEDLGTTRLLIKTTSEEDFRFAINLDNYGSDFTGQYRLRASTTANNLAGIADTLNINLVQTLDPTNSIYGAINYSLPLLTNGLIFGLNYSENGYSVGDVFTDLGIEGDSSVSNIYGRYSFKRSRAKDYFTRFGFAQKSATSKGLEVTTTDELSVIYASIGFSANDTLFSGRHFGELKISQGLKENELADTASNTISPKAGVGKFTKLNLDYSHSFPLSGAKNQYLLITTKFQNSSDELKSLEQMPLGGPQSVRAYPSSEYLVDKGLSLNLEWVARTLPSKDLQWFKNVQLSAYIDYARGSINDDVLSLVSNNSVDSNTVTLKGLGFALSLNPSKGFQLRADLAFPISKPESNTKSRAQFLLNFGYQI